MVCVTGIEPVTTLSKSIVHPFELYAITYIEALALLLRTLLDTKYEHSKYFSACGLLSVHSRFRTLKESDTSNKYNLLFYANSRTKLLPVSFQ